MKPLVYLASPYSNDDAQVRHYRHQKAIKATASLVERGFLVFSPIVHSVPLVEVGGLGTVWADWAEYDKAFLQHCSIMAILKLPGWRESVGVQTELLYARKLALQLAQVDPVTYRMSEFDEASG